MHEYSVKNSKKIHIIIGIALLGATIVTWLLKILAQFPLIPSFSISSLSVATLLYLLFNKILWKMKLINLFLGCPNLNGKWKVEGKSTKNSENYDWEGIIEIVQTYDEILISLKTSNSTSKSNSVTGNIEKKGKEFQLSYNYENIPNSNAPKEMRRHTGNCTIIFESNLKKAHGNYFNNSRDRQTFGEMNLTKED